MGMDKLSESQIEARTKELDGWSPTGGMLQKEFRFIDFSTALRFLNNVADKAKKMGHYPDMCISYNSVVCMLSTHEKEGITEADFKLAGKIDKSDQRVKDTQESKK